ncbi:MAG TPA: NAD(P)H-dependent glycerol-3-phosphate dehydrogenase [Terriglobales bacterium]|nr:NAD(P)H-dependent glycerol-3-phosphate dehydrogenase [Terriglobales bacterium]
MSEIAIIGAGAWGTSLSIVLGRRGTHRVRLWAHEKEVRDSISARRINQLFLPDHAIPGSVTATDSFEEALRDAGIVVSVMPSQHCRGLFRKMHPFLKPRMLFVSATKGLEETTLLRMTEVISLVVETEGGFKPRIGALSGPTFAKEVARGDPTAITVASGDAGLAETVQREFSDASFRVYTNGDVTGVELGGALKNIIAIAAGVCDGLGLGHNSIAALITRGLAEITRLVVACGGRQETMSGLAGLGDLVLTCTGGLSRNRSVGVELGRGRKLPEIIAAMHGMVAEGVFTTHAAVELARAREIEMPITAQMDAILHHDKSPRDAIHDLMTRSAKSETKSM